SPPTPLPPAGGEGGNSSPLSPPGGRGVGGEGGGEQPISMFARQVRARRRLDTALTLAALQRSLGGSPPDMEGAAFLAPLAPVEDRLESEETPPEKELAEAQDRITECLARRLVARGQTNNPGFLVLNPCSFKRRVALELDGVRALPPLAGRSRRASSTVRRR